MKKFIDKVTIGINKIMEDSGLKEVKEDPEFTELINNYTQEELKIKKLHKEIHNFIHILCDLSKSLHNCSVNLNSLALESNISQRSTQRIQENIDVINDNTSYLINDILYKRIIRLFDSMGVTTKDIRTKLDQRREQRLILDNVNSNIEKYIKYGENTDELEVEKREVEIVFNELNQELRDLIKNFYCSRITLLFEVVLGLNELTQLVYEQNKPVVDNITMG